MSWIVDTNIDSMKILGRRSIFWNFFEKCTDDTIRCKICSKILKRNMTRHFRLKHRALHKKMLPLLKKPAALGGSKAANSFWVKKYSTEIGSNKFQCDLCKSVMKMPKAHGNMKRHIRAKHPKVYEMEEKAEGNQKQKDADETDLESDVEYLEEYIFDEKTSSEENVKKVEAELETSGSPVPEDIVYQDVNDVEPAWDASQYDEIEYISDTDPESEKKIKWLAQRSVPGKRNALSCVWNFYKPVEPNHTYNCLFCRKTISIFPYSCSNLRRHLARKHKNQYKIIMQYGPDRNKFSANLGKLLENTIPAGDFTKSFENSYFEAQEDGRYKCRSCGEVLETNESDSLVLFKHIHEKHGEEVISGLKDNVDEDEEFSVMFVKKKDLKLL